MKSLKPQLLSSLLAVAALTLTLLPTHAEEATNDDTVPVSMTVTASVSNGKRMPDINRNDVQVRRGKERLQVTSWEPARGDRAGLDLFILIDDASDPVFGSHLDDLRSFINAQPATTTIGVGYMRNGTLEIAQDLTSDHAAAAGALRIPLSYPGAYGSAYLSVMDLMKRWPENRNRHEVLMITDGVDRARHLGLWQRGFSTNPDVESASAIAQRTGTMIYTIYVPGTGRFRLNHWSRLNGQMDAARLSDKTGGQSYYLGLQNPVSIAPYLAELQKSLENQYIVSFVARPGKKSELQSVRLSTEVAGVELASHTAVWVPASR
jgi:hypothetical protein